MSEELKKEENGGNSPAGFKMDLGPLHIDTGPGKKDSPHPPVPPRPHSPGPPPRRRHPGPPRRKPGPGWKR